MSGDARSVERWREWRARCARWSQRAWSHSTRALRLGAWRLGAGVEYLQLVDGERQLRAKQKLVQAEVGRLVIEIHRERGAESGFAVFPEIKSELERIDRVERALERNAASATKVRARLRGSPPGLTE